METITRGRGSLLLYKRNMRMQPEKKIWQHPIYSHYGAEVLASINFPSQLGGARRRQGWRIGVKEASKDEIFPEESRQTAWAKREVSDGSIIYMLCVFPLSFSGPLAVFPSGMYLFSWSTIMIHIVIFVVIPHLPRSHPFEKKCFVLYIKSPRKHLCFNNAILPTYFSHSL